jgi:aspartate aminotransferase-like enzyme
MPISDLQLPTRLLAGGGPSTPDPRVLRALSTPVIGQFDPDFTAVMDDVVRLARATFLTRSAHCFAISALAGGGLEAVLNTLTEQGDSVAIDGSAAFIAETAEIVRRSGGHPVGSAEQAAYLVVPFIDPFTAVRTDVRQQTLNAHARGTKVIVEATQALAAIELRVDDWHLDVCVGGADHAIGAPSGMSLVAYSAEINQRMQHRSSPPKTSYLDLLQLQAYWSPERLNHHTAPTSLIYALREALRLVQLEGLVQRWTRHTQTATQLRDGLRQLGLEPSGDVPFAVIHVADEPPMWRRLLEEFGIHVTRLEAGAWRMGLLGADARPDAVHQVLNALASQKILAA